MKYHKKYLKLIDFFLTKRDSSQGGVDGFYTPFDFTLPETEALGITSEELFKMLKQMENDKVKIDGHEFKLMEPYEQNGDTIIINNLSTDKLDAYKERVLRSIQGTLSVKIEFTDDGRLVDVNNNVEINKYGQDDDAYDLCHYLFNQCTHGEWINWDQIDAFITGMRDIVLNQVEIRKHKKKIYDSIRGINQHAKNKIRQIIIENDGKDRYKVAC